MFRDKRPSPLHQLRQEERHKARRWFKTVVTPLFKRKPTTRGWARAEIEKHQGIFLLSNKSDLSEAVGREPRRWLC